MLKYFLNYKCYESLAWNSNYFFITQYPGLLAGMFLLIGLRFIMGLRKLIELTATIFYKQQIFSLDTVYLG